jgi:Cof subfamily protein (haloacid dehalogenase superfamily)
MYKIVTVDLDGTLLNSAGEVSDYTKDIIQKSINRGTDVILASGRPINSVESIAYEIGSKNYLISGNGAIVYDIAKKEVIYDRFLNKEQVLNIVRICEENSIYCNVYTEMEVIAKSLNYNVLFYYKENARKAEGKRTNINIVPNMYKYIEELSQERFLKVTVCDDNRMIFNSIIRKLKLINDIDVLDVSHMSRKVIKDGTSQIPIEYYYTEITNKNVNKWTAIEFLLNKLHIQKEDVIGIGDNVNDKEMIENAGLGVAMGNSSPEMKAIADVVVSDNNSEGVAEVIRKFVLEDY